MGFKDDRSGIDFTQIGDEFIRIIHDSESHRYLGRKLNLHAKSRIAMEFSNRKQQAWFAFNKHKKVLLNHHISLKKRLKYFDTCVTPAILFALCSFPLRKRELDSLDILQRKMMRRIVGWRRIEGEDWQITMTRMKFRLDRGQNLHRCEEWSIFVMRQ